MGSRNSNNFPYFIISRVDYCFNEKDIMFRAMLHRTIGYTFNHKKTRAIIEGELIRFMEDPKTRKL